MITGHCTNSLRLIAVNAVSIVFRFLWIIVRNINLRVYSLEVHLHVSYFENNGILI